MSLRFEHSFQCSCGRTHECPIREVVVGHGALGEVPLLLDGISRVLIVSDTNTRPLAIDPLLEGLNGAGILFEEAFFETDEVLIPDEQAIAFIEQRLAEAATENDKPIGAIIGIGSGVINDLCKYVSFRAGLPYMIIATAPSMDGFASVGAALILKGMKVTLNARVAAWIVGDTQILKDAPMDMIRAGIGDILGKYSCLNDWKLAHVVTGEHMCRYIYDMTMDEVLTTRRNIRGCMDRDEEAVGELMTSLVKVGIAMAYMGNSRPASGAEHHFSHFFEITGVAFGEPYLPHGIDVAYASILTASLREMLSKADPKNFSFSFDPEAWASEAEPVFRGLFPEVKALQEKVGLYLRDDVGVIRERWAEICGILQEAPGTEEMKALLSEAGFEMGRFVSFYGEEKIRTCMRWAKDLKDRYTVLWLLQSIGLLEDFTRSLPF